MSAETTTVYPPSAAAMKGAHVSGMPAYRALVAEAEADHPGFWARQARELISWKTPFTQVLDDSAAPFFRWFADGTLNASYNCLDRQIEAGLGDKVALIFEADDAKVTRVTYRELLAKTCRLANALKRRGIKKGDRVIIYIGMSVEGVVAMQACARIGATHSVVVRRLLGAIAARPHRRHRRGAGDHRRRAIARRQAAATEGDRRRRAGARRLRVGQGRDRLPAHRRRHCLERRT